VLVYSVVIVLAYLDWRLQLALQPIKWAMEDMRRELKEIQQDLRAASTRDFEAHCQAIRRGGELDALKYKMDLALDMLRRQR
jgi:hypothetical protein